jgi:hypothetical protein
MTSPCSRGLSATLPLLALVGAGLLSSPSARALESEQEAVATQELERVVKPKVQQGSTDPSSQSPVQGKGLAPTIEATTKDKVATVKVGFHLGDDEKNLAFVKVSSPIDEDADQTEVANLRGLRDVPKAEFGLRRVFWHLRQLGTASERRATWAQGCKDAGLAPECSWSSLPPQAKSSIFTSSVPFLVGLSGEVGNKSYSFLDPSSLAKESSSRTSFSVAGAFGVYPAAGKGYAPGGGNKAGGRLYYLGINGRLEQSYKAGAKAEICQPIASTEAEKCSDAVLGGPTKTTKHLGELEIRYYLGKNDQILLNPKIVRDFKNHTTGLELPVFFIKGPDGGLNGGLALGWTSDKKALTAVVFVGGVAPVW